MVGRYPMQPFSLRTRGILALKISIDSGTLPSFMVMDAITLISILLFFDDYNSIV